MNVKAKYEPVIKKVKDQRDRIRKVVTGSPNVRVRDVVRNELKRPVAIALLDKLSFTLGIFNLMVTQFFITNIAKYFWAWYLIWAVALISLRFSMYRKKKWHYFLIDFCYFANCMCILYVLLFWGNARFFFVIFTLCNGPLAWAIVAWRNSLVFHSLDKVTTVFIHGFPPLFTYCHRWLEHRTHSIDCSEAPNDCGSGYSAVYGVPLLAYLLWQALYVFKTDVADKRKLKQDTSIQTSLRWLARDDRGALYRLSRAVSVRLGVLRPDERMDGETRKTKLIFMSSQLVYTLITFLPIPLLYHSFYAHTIFLITLLLVATWNGAIYYFDVFSQRYAKQIASSIAAKTTDATSPDAMTPASNTDTDMANATASDDVTAEDRPTVSSSMPVQTIQGPLEGAVEGVEGGQGRTNQRLHSTSIASTLSGDSTDSGAGYHDSAPLPTSRSPINLAPESPMDGRSVYSEHLPELVVSSTSFTRPADQ